VNLPTFLFLSAAAASPITPGIRDAVESPHATMRELALEYRAPMRRDEEHEQRHSFAPKIAAIAAPAPQAESVVTKPTIAAPRITAGFAASHELGQYPSDAAGAVSSKYLLHVSNASVVAQDRAGVILSNITLASFWHAPAYPDGPVFDSRVFYDGVADRWVFCSLYDLSSRKSTLLIAVSDSGNPSLGWHRYRYTVDPADASDADFTRMSQTADSIAITATIFSQFSEFSDVFTIRKSDAYSAPATLPVSQKHTDRYDLVPVDGPDDPHLYIIERSSIASINVYSYAAGTLNSIANAFPPANINTDIGASIAPQRGSPIKLNCDYLFIYNSVLKNGAVWIASQVYRDSPVRSSVLWWRIALSTPPRFDVGLIDDATGATMYAFPSIAVNKFGAALIGYSVFNASIYPSPGFSYVDPLNNLSTPAFLKTGDAPSPLSRWADYSTTVVDANDIDFWTNQTYVPIGPAWATWWSKIDMPALPRGRAVHH
jgi:hypothetical protein